MEYDNSKIEKLKIISKLYSEGVLTKEEMEAEKQKIMGNSTSSSSAHQEDASETVGTGKSAAEDNEQANQAASNACGTKSEQNGSEDSAVYVEKVDDKPKFHLPTWAYGVIPMAVVLIIIGVIYLVKYSKEGAAEEVTMEETYDDGLPKRIYVNNSTTLDELFCDENVGDTIDYFEQGNLTHGGDYENGPIATAIEYAEYINCVKAGPRTGMNGVIKYGYKGQDDTYYCDGNTSAGGITDPLIWVYNRKTKKLYAYSKPHFTYDEFYDLFKKYENDLHRERLPKSFEAGGVTVKRIKTITHTLCEYDELLGSELVGTYYIYASDNVTFKNLDFESEGYDFCQPIFDCKNEDDWMVAIFSIPGYTLSFYIPHPAFVSVSQGFSNDNPETFIGSYYEDYFIREYITHEDNSCMVRFTQTPTVNEVCFWILGYD